jgi:hypothetical protein
MAKHHSLHLALALLFLTLGCAAPREPDPYVAVTLDVDFGPSGQGVRSERVFVPEGANAIDALAETLPIEHGFVCCTRGDVWSVDGVSTDPNAGHYWLFELNGRLSRLAPDRYELENGDHITWVYSRAQRPEHRRN